MKLIKTALIISSLIFIFILFNLLFADFITHKFINNLDLSINSFTPKIENNFLTVFSEIIAFIFDTITLIIISMIVSIYLWFNNNKKESLFFIVTMLLTSGFIFVIKNLVQRVRPINSIIPETSFAFPSGHVTTAVVFFGLFTYLILIKNKSKSIKSLILSSSMFMIVLISFTRLYLNAHWLTDILGGIAFGSFILASFIMIYKSLPKKPDTVTLKGAKVVNSLF